jgi:hypothetical protein
MCFVPPFQKCQPLRLCSVRAPWHFENLAGLLLKNRIHRCDVLRFCCFLKIQTRRLDGVSERFVLLKILSPFFSKNPVYPQHVVLPLLPFEQQG